MNTPTDAATPAPVRFYNMPPVDPAKVVRGYLAAAVAMIDEQFGHGHAAKYPSLVAACIEAQASASAFTSVSCTESETEAPSPAPAKKKGRE